MRCGSRPHLDSFHLPSTILHVIRINISISKVYLILSLINPSSRNTLTFLCPRILCTNRDEYLARPTLPAAFHSFGLPQSEVARGKSEFNTTGDAGKFDAVADDSESTRRVLSGLDTLAGGTWLGLAPSSGRIALLTNITEQPHKLSSSRGALVPAFLLADPTLDSQSNASSSAFDSQLQALYPATDQYAGFNLLVLAAEWETASLVSGVNRRLHFPHAALLSNGGARGPIVSRALRSTERACGGVSNAANTCAKEEPGSEWPKVAEGRTLFAEVLAAHAAHPGRHSAEANLDVDPTVDEDVADAALAARLFTLLRTTAKTPIRSREDLRRTIHVAPLEVAAGPNKGWYATRLATVLLVRRTGEARFVERDVWRLSEGKDGGVELADTGAERVFRVRVGGGAPCSDVAGAA
ncbi:NRDE protein-domain-containing protein [Mycena crocata]|nr:NRDE protein-domain-containing protein [Mycena crocata]